MARKKAAKAKPAPRPLKPAKACPLTRTQFSHEAEPLRVAIRGANVLDPDGGPAVIELLVSPKQFKSGTLGWYINDKAHMMFDGAPLRLQIQVSVQVCHSKSLPGGPAADSPAGTDS